jgi:formylglycine-generating enzyme required for sulfatase activity
MLAVALVVSACATGPDPAGWDDAAVLAVHVTADGTAWLGAGDGSLLRVRSGTAERIAPPPGPWGPVHGIADTDRGVIVAAGRRVVQRVGGRWEDVHTAPEGTEATAVAGTGGGVVVGLTDRWTGSGSVLVPGAGEITLHDRVPLIESASAVRAVAVTPEGTWVATTGAGVVLHAGEEWRLSAMVTGALRDDHVFALAPDPSGGAWVATQAGVVHVTPGAAEHHEPVALPRAVAAGPDAVWAGGHSGGVACLDRATGLWTEIVPPGGSTVTVMAAAEGGAWAGTADGSVLRLSAQGVVERREAGGSVTALAAGGPGEVWAGTPGGRAVLISPSGNVEFSVVPMVGEERHAAIAAALDADLVAIPAGPFPMGSDRGRDDEAPVHTVTLPAFSVMRHEVTNAQYGRYVDAAGTPPPAPWPAGRVPSGEARFPVTGVRAEEAAAFCEWAGMRLPTEAEWERSARGTDGREYPWGGEWDPARANTAAGGPGHPVAVGSYPTGAGPEGLLDSAGNAAEWVADYYDAGYYAEAPDHDPRGPEAVVNRVRRGGSWASALDEARVAHRASSHGSSPDLRAGFRCAAG